MKSAAADAKEERIEGKEEWTADSANEGEDAVVSDQNLSDGQKWLKIERLRESQCSNPWRSTEEPEDPDRLVLVDDISGALLEYPSDHIEIRFRLLTGVMQFFGAEILPFHSSKERKRWEAMEEMAGGRFENLPNLHRTVSMDERERLERIFGSVEDLIADQSHLLEFLVCCRVHYSARRLHGSNLPSSEKLKQFKRISRETISLERNRNSLPLYLTFAKNLAAFGAKKEAETTAKTALSLGCRQLDFGSVDQQYLAILNLVLAWVKLNLEKRGDGWLNHSARVLANFVVSGTFSADDWALVSSTPALLIKAKRRLTEEILPAVFSGEIPSEDNSFSAGWLGSPMVLLTEVCGWFSYCCGNDLPDALEFFDETAAVLRRLKLKEENIRTPKFKMLDRQLELLFERKLRLLNSHTERARFYSVKSLTESVESVLTDFPTNADFLAQFVSVNLKGHLMVKLRRFFDLQTKSVEDSRDVSESEAIWLAAIYAEFTRFLNVVNSEVTDTAELPEIHRLRNVLERATEACPDCPNFWRYYMRLEALKGSTDKARQVFYRAVRQCPWSKDIYTDMTDICPVDVQMVTDLMVEKEIRLRLPLEELELLKEAANKEAEEGDSDSSQDIVEVKDENS